MATKYPSKASKKIALIVGIQIGIILVSFIILESFESQKIFLGNSVNMAGKNRYYAMLSLSEVKSEYIGGKITGDPTSVLRTYEENLRLLKGGGSEDGIQLAPLPEKLSAQWSDINDVFLKYKKTINDFAVTGYEESEIIEISSIADQLVKQNDELTADLAFEVQSLTTTLIWLQIILAIVNIATHLLMIRLIYRVLKTETERLMKMERMYTIGQMSARLAHDMKNPLSVIKTAISMLLMGSEKIDAETRKYYKLIDTATSRVVHQINDVMDFVKEKKIQLELHSAKDIVYSASITTEIPQNIKLNLPSNDVQVRCDRRHIEVMLSNLISNAVEAIDEKPGTVTIRILDSPKDISFEVEDSGQGIPDNVMPRIFEPLFTTKQKGTGLGLVSCMNIAEAHGGTISVQNNPTRFTVTIPKNTPV